MRTAQYEEYDEPERKKAALYIVIALLILGLFGLLAWFVAGNLLGGDPVTVPKVVGLQQDEAEAALDDVDLRAEIVEKTSKKPEGEVLKQDPKAGEEVQTGATVTLTVSSGLGQTSVPDVVGMTLEEATQTLKDARLKVGVVTEVPAEGAADSEVLRQFPPADREVEVGTPIDLDVAAGSTVPDVTGMAEDEAISVLNDAGYEVSVSTEPSNEVEEGIVIAQDPDGGTEYEQGQTVTILVSEGPEAQEMPDVTGADGDEAEAFLEEDFGLDVTQVDADPGDCGAAPPGTVCVQDPEPGTPVEPGDTATLYVQPGDAFWDRGGTFAWVIGLLF